MFASRNGMELSNPVGRLRLELLQLYFVKSKEPEFSALGVAVYRTPPDLNEVASLLCNARTLIHEGTPCGWQPLNLALIRGGSHHAVVQLLLAAKADPTAAPKSHKTATPLMICAQVRRAALAALLLHHFLTVDPH